MKHSATTEGYSQLTLEQRGVIEVLAPKPDVLQTEIAQAIKVNQSTVSRELARNSIGGVYDAHLAHNLAQHRAYRPDVCPILDSCPELVKHVIHYMENKRNVKQALFLTHQKYPKLPTVCAETLYQWAYTTASPEADRICKLLTYPRTERKKRSKRKSNRGKLKNQQNIAKRSKLADKRRVFGFWEGDLVMGKAGKTAVVTLVERKTRYTIIIPLELKTSKYVVQTIIFALSFLPPKAVRSITWDNGKEMAEHEMLAELLDINIYFADPHSPWQRGTNENTNGQLRKWYPKGTDFECVTYDDWKKVEQWLNTRPMEVLSMKTPEELFLKNLKRLVRMHL